MKKFFFLMLAISSAINVVANSSVKSGDVNVLKDNSVTFSVEFDFSKTIVEDKPYKEYLASRNDDWNRDWPQDQKKGLQSFVKKWNKKNKAGAQAVESGKAAYRLVIKPTSLHFGNTALAWTVGFGAGGMKMSGTMVLYKGKTKVLEIDVAGQTGKSSVKETTRFCSLMEELADDTIKNILK